MKATAGDIEDRIVLVIDAIRWVLSILFVFEWVVRGVLLLVDKGILD